MIDVLAHSATVADAVGAALAEAGVDHVFGVVGSGNFAVTNALVAAGARWIPARHEGGAVVMTDAFARITRRVPACSVHQGPGLTNTITGLTEAAKSRTPMLVLAGDAPAGALHSNFRIDQAGLAAAVGALFARLDSPETAVTDALRAHSRAVRERRPLLLSMPIDVQAAAAADEPEIQLPRPPPVPTPSAADISAAADLLAGARRPLVIAGRGAAISGARRPIEALAGQVGALLATSAAAHGLFANSPWSVGISGGFASPVAAGLIREADVVLALGASLNMWTTRRGKLIGQGAALIQVDVEAGAIGVHRPAQVGLVGDVAETVEALTTELGRRGHLAESWRTPELGERLRQGSWSQTPFQDQSGQGQIDPRRLTVDLDRMLPMERTVIVDSGHFMGWPAMYMRVPDEQGFVFTQAFQAVGLGLGSAIGAAVARPDRLAVAALGDGGVLMGASELETAVRLGVRLLVAVYNDAAYGAEVHHFGPDGHRLDIVRFPDTDIAAIGRGAGAAGVTVREPSDLDAVRDWLDAGSAGVLVVDAKLVPTVVGEWLPEAFGH